MSFFEDQEDDWYANGCKGAPSDYYAGELAPWCDHFTDTSLPAKGPTQTPRTRSKSKKRRDQRIRAEARKKATGQKGIK